jgi:hypothetical protein
LKNSTTMRDKCFFCKLYPHHVICLFSFKVMNRSRNIICCELSSMLKHFFFADFLLFCICFIKFNQLLAHGRWFSPCTPASSTTKTGHHDIAEILLKVALKQLISCRVQSSNDDITKTYSVVCRPMKI